jgi:hypothetical protein
VLRAGCCDGVAPFLVEEIDMNVTRGGIGEACESEARGVDCGWENGH